MYSILIIDSDNISDYTDNIAEAIRYNNLSKEDLDKPIEISLKHDYSVVVQKNDKEDK